MKCPYCSYRETKVTDTRMIDNGEKIRRRRECIKCGICETRCPFGVKVRENMEKAKSVFGY